MKRKDLNILVLKSLGLKKNKKIENLTWDSLGHLTILVELEASTNKKKGGEEKQCTKQTIQ